MSFWRFVERAASLLPQSLKSFPPSNTLLGKRQRDEGITVKASEANHSTVATTATLPPSLTEKLLSDDPTDGQLMHSPTHPHGAVYFSHSSYVVVMFCRCEKIWDE